VRRRDLIAGVAGLVGTAKFGLPSVGRGKTLTDPGAGLEGMLYRSTAKVEPVPLAALRTAITAIRVGFGLLRKRVIFPPCVAGIANSRQDP
jgi:hypothetical protein